MEKAQRYHFNEDRCRYIAGRYFLRRLLGGYLNVDSASISFIYNEFGKPFVPDAGIYFNISNTANIILYAFSRIPEIGIDVEVLNENFPNLEVAKRFFTMQKIEVLEHLDSGDLINAFYTCWTRKESYIKAKGYGLSIPLNSFAVLLSNYPKSSLLYSELFSHDVELYTLFTFSPYEGYLASLAVANRSSSFRFFDGKSNMELSFEH